MKKLLLFFVASIILVVSVRGADSPTSKSADELWRSIQQMTQLPAAQDRAELLERLTQLHSNVLEFESRFPSNPHHWEARLVHWETEAGLARAEDQPVDNEPLFRLAKEIGPATDVSADFKTEVEYLVAQKRMEALGTSGSVTNGPARAAADAAIQDLRQKYPDDVRTLQIQFDMAGLLKTADPGAAEAIFHELAGSKNPQAVAMARQQLDAMKVQRGLGKEPMELKFEAVDGTKVDLANLRGKVVLVDFWATWCGPCRMEIPNVVATYKRLHDQGFEIVGISLDQNKEQMLKYTQTAGMPWPQYFDGKMWSNEISTRFGITGIPAAWLLDKKGVVRSTQARGADLEQQVKMLLAE